MNAAKIGKNGISGFQEIKFLCGLFEVFVLLACFIEQLLTIKL